ncbi:MAG TPA: chromosome segregation protein SMC, partial [Gammaproteobacteria bacterium]|nr:chromosome segregation protein SMC [Gammaproteobacteria bacterium]
MRLKKIKLAGFKSFVDPTQVEFPHLLTGIVGPNGCGKSNIIDAIRWVMGESSAKMLRGQSMEDVIFSGSQSRKPVGKAFVELIFDNTVGKKAPGNYAKYSEIAIRREVTRDGRSDYFLNRTKCRKKDIVDVFLGTGLGPRAYSIIEQGMVTRIIESRPEELRVFVEEAAGISRYKERRRETENRIRHTRENMSRVEDIRSELESQLARLKRQASAARRYKEHKNDERRLQSELLALRWQGLTDRIVREETELEGRQTRLEGQLAKQRETEANIEKARQQQHDVNEAFNQAQGQYYQTGAEVSRIEQSIQHARDSFQEKQREKERLDSALKAAREGFESDSRKEEELTAKLNAGASDLESLAAKNEKLAEALTLADTEMHDWQQRWDGFSNVAAHPAREREVQSARITQITDHIARLQSRRTRLGEENETLQSRISQSSTTDLRDELEQKLVSCKNLNEQIDALDTEIQQLRSDIESTGNELNAARVERQSVTARLETLRELQDAALGKHDQQMHEWLQQVGMQDLSGLADCLEVEKGWEAAVDRVLGTELTGVCLAGRQLPLNRLGDLQGKGSTFFEASGGIASHDSSMLASRIKATDVSLNARLASVYIAEDIDAAIAARTQRPEHAVTVTRDGSLVGRDWISLAGGQDNETGVMSRQTEIDMLAEQLDAARENIDQMAARHKVLQEKLGTSDAQRREIRDRYNRETAQANEENARLHRLEAELDQMRNRNGQIERELAEIDEQIVLDQAELTSSDDRLAAASQQADEIEQQRNSMLGERQRLQQNLDQSRQTAHQSDEDLHHLQLQHQEWEVTIRSLQDSLQRTRQQLDMLHNREKDLASSLDTGKAPEQNMQAELDVLLGRRLSEEGSLKQRREGVVALESRQRELEQQRHAEE